MWHFPQVTFGVINTGGGSGEGGGVHGFILNKSG